MFWDRFGTSALECLHVEWEKVAGAPVAAYLDYPAKTGRIKRERASERDGEELEESESKERAPSIAKTKAKTMPPHR